MKKASALVALLAIAAAIVAYSSISNTCWNTHYFSILYSTLIGFDRTFSFEENLLVWSDRLTSASTADSMVRCAMNKEPAPMLALRDSFQLEPRWRGPFVFGGNNFNYGFVDVRDNTRVKVTSSQDVLGVSKLEDVFLVVRSPERLEWYGFNRSLASFERQDSRCLECHNKRKDFDFLFSDSDYLRFTMK